MWAGIRPILLRDAESGEEREKRKFNFMDHKIVGLVGKREREGIWPGATSYNIPLSPRAQDTQTEAPSFYPPPLHQSGRRQGRPHVDHTEKKYFFPRIFFSRQNREWKFGKPHHHRAAKLCLPYNQAPSIKARRRRKLSVKKRKKKRERGEFLSAFCLTTKPC